MGKGKQLSMNDINLNEFAAMTDQEREKLQKTMGMADQKANHSKKAM